MSTVSWQSWCAIVACCVSASYAVSLRTGSAGECENILGLVNERSPRCLSCNGNALAKHAHGDAVKRRALGQNLVHVQYAPRRHGWRRQRHQLNTPRHDAEPGDRAHARCTVYTADAVGRSATVEEDGE